MLRPIFLPALLLILFFSCRRREKSGTDNDAYLNHVFDQTDSIASGQDHLPEAYAYLDSVYRALPRPSVHDQCRRYEYKRWHCQQAHNYLMAETYCDSALYLTRERESDYRQSPDYYNALLAKGDALLSERDYSDAFRYYFEAKQLTDQTADTCSANLYSSTLGTVCYKQGRYREASGYFLEDYNELLHCHDTDAWGRFCNVQGSLDNIALGYTGAGLLDSALYYYDSARRVIGRYGDVGSTPDSAGRRRFLTQALGIVCGNEGDAWYRKGDTTRAEALYRQSITLDRHKNEEDAQFTRVKLARLYMDDNRIPLAGQVLEGLRLSLDTFPSVDAELRYRQVSWRYNDRVGRVQDAYRDLLTYTHLKDSLDAGRPLSALDINEELRHAATGFDFQLLQRRDRLKDVYLLIATLFALMTLVIITLVIQNGRRSRRHVRELTGLNRQMHNALGALEQSHRENTRLLKVMAHDLRNPIGASGSFASILLEEVDMDEEHRHMLELVRASSQSCLDMITDLLHSNTTRENLVKESVDFEALLHYCVAQLRFKAEEKQQTLEVRAGPVTLLLNREKIWRVLSNLLTNAIKFSPSGTTIHTALFHKNREVWITIRDEGIGIPADLRAGIFDLFGESKRKGTAGEESFGLGLGISKQIVEAHGGKIWFESEEGMGTTFFITFPED